MDLDLVRLLAEEAGLFVAGYVLGALLFLTVVLPLLYTFPRAAAWAMQWRLRWRALPGFLVSPILWVALFGLGAYLLLRYAPDVSERLYARPLFFLGLLLGIGHRAFRAIGSKAGRLKLRDNFFDRVRSHLKARAPTEDERMGEDIYDRIWHVSRAGTRSGPFTYEELRRQAKRGKLRGDDLLWRPGVASYVEASTVLGPVEKRSATR
ncbi:DUF4339 domain-containing protein [Methyloceanibacter sp.]|jgi:hypothetical protein|uniref:DUF4339 domain-containing protein n=1 Tax=Methyloceanibacter sp. TaxID=1965321 RepID=UPI003569F3D7